MKATKFHCKNRELTAYALHCGCIQQLRGEHFWIKLYEDCSQYHVMCGWNDRPYSIWETFEFGQLTIAKKFYKDTIKRLNKEISL